MKFDDDQLLEWNVTLEEVSAGVYRASARDRHGHSVTMTGEEPEPLLQQCKSAALAQLGIGPRKPNSGS